MKKNVMLFAAFLMFVAVFPEAASAVDRRKAVKSKNQVKAEEGYFEGADGVRIFYRKLGHGPDFVVYLHGGPGLTMADGGFAMEPLGEHHTLILYDQRGAGRSELVKDTAKLTAEYDVRDLEALRKRFGIEKMTLIGLSWGTGLAAFYAEAHPEHVSRMVMVSPMPIGINPWAKERNEKIASLMSAEDRARLQEIRSQGETADAAQLKKLCPEEFRIIFTPYLANPGDHSDVWNRMCDVSVEAMRNGGVTGGAVINSLGEFDLRPAIGKFKGPVLVIEGAKTNVPLSSTLEWAKSPAQGRLLMVPDSGHAVFIEQPAAMLRAIEVFLRGKWPDGAALPRN